MKRMYAYDIECYPNFVSVYFEDMLSNEERVFYLHADLPNEHNSKNWFQLLTFLNTSPILVGYNNRNYDDTILSALHLKNFNGDYKALLEFIYNLNEHIIHSSYGDKMPKEYYDIFRHKWEFNSIDVMKILRHDQLKKSLKQTLINIKFHTIESLPIEPGTYIQIYQIPDLLKYNGNDVKGTKELCLFIKDELEQRLAASADYNLKELVNTSRASLAGKVLAIKYSKKTGLPISEFIDKRTYTKAIALSGILSKKVNFKTPLFKELYIKLNRTIINSTNEINYSIICNGLKFNIKSGGLHSADKPGIFRSDDKYTYIDCDGSSYYPRNIVNERITAAHLGQSFVEIIDEDSTERIRIKHLKDKKSQNTAKLVKILLNAIFGGFNSEYKFWYDRAAFVKTTINGQLFLLMLIEELTEAGFQVVSANTDGIVTKVENTKRKIYDRICRNWEDKIKIELEYTEYKTYIKKDVNNYLAVSKDGKIKRKGDLNKDNYKNYQVSGSFPGYSYPIVAEAVENYFLHNKEIMTTLLEAKDILDFCLTQKADKKFQFILQQVDKETSSLIDVPLQKDLRFYISNFNNLLDLKYENKTVTLLSGKLLKREKKNQGSLTKNTAICKGFLVTPYNIDYNQLNKPIELSNFKIDYNFYKTEVMQIINSIKAGTTDKKKIGLNLNSYKLEFEDDDE